MRKSRWLSWFSNDLPNYLLIILSAILLLAGLLRVISTFRLYEQAEARHFTNGASWWLKRIEQALLPFTFALWIALLWYKDQLRNRLETIKQAIKMRKIVYIVWWTTILTLALVTVRVFTVFYRDSGKLIFDLIILALIVLFLVYILVTSRVELRYYREQPLCNITAAGLLEKHTKFLAAHDFDKAYDALVKACETVPDGTELCCRLAFFCEVIRKNTTETDKWMAKAGELISTKKANSDSDRACYLNYLGMIMYERGEYDKGLEYMKQSIDIEPRPERINMYDKKLSEFKDKQKNAQF